MFNQPSMLQLRASDELEWQKYMMLELREHYETLQERREYCIKVLCYSGHIMQASSIGCNISSLNRCCTR